MITKIFHVSIPFEQPNTGDYDYGTALVKALDASGQPAEYVSAATAGYVLGSKAEVGTVSHAVELVNAARGNAAEFQSAYVALQQNPDRKAAIQQIKDHILKTATKEGITPILNLQLRAPETGFAFMPEDLENFKRAGIKVNVTCHEYKLNNTRRHLQSVLHGYFKAADSVTFFNPKDKDNACKHADKTAFTDISKFPTGDAKATAEVALFTTPPYDLSSKTFLTRVPPTVNYVRPTLEEFQERPPNLIAFGLIRENKGFEEALDIAKNMNGKTWPEGAKPRMIIAGVPASSALLAKIICAKYTPDAVKKVISENITQVLDKSEIDVIAEKHRKIARETQEIDKICANPEFQKLVNERVGAVHRDEVEDTKIQTIRRNIAKTLLEKEITKDTVKESIKDSTIYYIISSATKSQGPSSFSPLVQGTAAKYAAQYPELATNSGFLRDIESKVNETLTTKQEKTMEKILDQQKGSGHEDQQHATLGAFVDTLSRRTGPGDLEEASPIDLRLNVPSDQMPPLFAQAKYAVKIDNKGWANNASGHINAFANGCIVYTGWGMDTPDEVLPARKKGGRDIPAGQYCGAIPFLEGKYSLREARHLTTAEERAGEKGKHYGISALSTKDPITADKILSDIERRESSVDFQTEVCGASHILDDISRRESGAVSNRDTFQIAQRLFEEQFAPDRIAVGAKVQYSAIMRRGLVVSLRSKIRHSPEDIEAVPRQGLYEHIDRVSSKEIREYKDSRALVDRDIKASKLFADRLRSKLQEHQPTSATSRPPPLQSTQSIRK